jgi:hypothetical protein
VSLAVFEELVDWDESSSPAPQPAPQLATQREQHVGNWVLLQFEASSSEFNLWAVVLPRKLKLEL